MKNKKLLSLIVLVATISVAACQQKASSEDDVKVVLSPAEFETKVSETKEAIVLDVCTPNEFGQQHINNAVNINYHADGFETHLEQMDKEKPYFVYCWAGSRSAKAAKLMRDIGFKHVFELKGGIVNWMKQNKPVKSGIKNPVTHSLHLLNSNFEKL